MIRIEPYNDKEVKSVLTNLMKNEEFMKFIKSNLNKSTSKFIGNHRDITLDSALCNFALDSIGLDTTFNAIGDNLVSVDWMGDLLRLNKSFVISRSGSTKKEIYSNLYKASQFIKD